MDDLLDEVFPVLESDSERIERVCVSRSSFGGWALREVVAKNSTLSDRSELWIVRVMEPPGFNGEFLTMWSNKQSFPKKDHLVYKTRLGARCEKRRLIRELGLSNSLRYIRDDESYWR